MTLRVYGRLFLFSLFVLQVLAVAVWAAEGVPENKSTTPALYTIEAVRAEQGDKGFVLKVLGSGQPTFTLYELFDPDRIVLDLAEAVFAESMKMPQEINLGPVSSINGAVLDDNKPAIARLEIFLSASAPEYTAERRGDDIVIAFQESTEALNNLAMEGNGESSAKVAGEDSVKPEAGKTVAAEKSDPVVAREEEPPPVVRETTVARQSASQTAFRLAGYDRQEITIDFYKIDLHNVFRLFGEISGLNIVIAEGVSGTLTLALNSVPWDFALDLILNLKDLQKIERHGTIVIAPKSTELQFAQQPTDNLKVKTVDGLKTGKPEKAQAPDGGKKGVQVAAGGDSREITEAKKIMIAARRQEKEGKHEEALALYEEAFAKWPANNRLAHRIASLFLVHQGMNAKAVHYAKQALKVEPNDRAAALYAAIGLANMKRVGLAGEYFDLAVSENEILGVPSSEALTSYAAFNEELGDYVSALLILARHDDIYGETVDAMVAKARIYDKEGNSQKAGEQYRAILLSGYKLPTDLSRYIKGRLALEDTNNKEQSQ